jgi:alanine racemase
VLPPTHRAWVSVDLEAIAHNICQMVHYLGPQVALMAVVKADAYGHGAVAVSEVALAHGAKWLAVATIEEGIQLREAGIKAPILLMGATNTPEEVGAVTYWKLQPTLCTPKQALTYSENLTKPYAVHLKVDTGMSRLGTSWQEAVPFVEWVKSLPYLEIASIYSHLATADEQDSAFLAIQKQRFDQVLAALPLETQSGPRPFLHLANSAGTLAHPQYHYDLVRVGLALYGLAPSEHLKSVLNLKPALLIQARITQVKTVTAGTGVSYGQTYHAVQDTRLATVALGYADGLPRNLSGKIEVEVLGKRVPQVGTITMDQCLIDISAVPQVQEGEVVTFLGKSAPSAYDWADLLSTIPYEILCGFKHRLPRVVLHPSVTPSEMPSWIAKRKLKDSIDSP